MAIDSEDDVIAGFQPYGTTFLAGFTPPATASWYALWAAQGVPGPGANAGSGVAGDIPTDATAGAIPFTNSNNTHLARFSCESSIAGHMILFDRLWQQSGLSPTTVGNQTVQASTPTVPLTRPDANGDRVTAWLTVFGTLGAGATAPTITYTDQSGNTGATGTAVNWAATAATNRNFPFSLAAGDIGIRSIQFYDNMASHTSGTFGLLLRRQVAAGSIVNNACGFCHNFLKTGLVRIYDDACLELVWVSSNTTALTLSGDVLFTQG